MMHDGKSGNICLGSNTKWSKPSVDPRESKWLLSIDLISFGQHDLDLVLT